MNYALGHAFNMDDMFMNFPYKKLNFTCEDCAKMTGDPHRDTLVKRIFREGLKMILLDIIENNVTFVLPTNGRYAEIHMRRTFGEEFKRARRNGKWREIDFLASNFSGNELVLNIHTGSFIKSKVIYVDKNLKNKIINNTNKGKQYC